MNIESDSKINDNYVMLSLGANLGERKENINKAIDILVISEVLHDVRLASFYETEPVGYTNQDWFINTVISGYTNLPLYALLSLCKSIEYELGRITRERWHEREIDIDILIYGNVVVNSKILTVPHPRMHERRFVLQPAAEIAGSFVHPATGRTLNELLDECKDKAVVKKLD